MIGVFSQNANAQSMVELLRCRVESDVTGSYYPKVYPLNLRPYVLEPATSDKDVLAQLVVLQKCFPKISVGLLLTDAFIYGGAELYYLQIMKNLKSTLAELESLSTNLTRPVEALERAFSIYNYDASEIMKWQKE